MKPILFIVAPHDFQDFEYAIPKSILEKEGIITQTASTRKQAKGKYGKSAPIDLLLEKVNPEDYEGVILIGGPGASIFIDDKKTHSLLQDFFKAQKLTAAICISPLTLAKAGVLKNQKATIHESYQKELKKMKDITVLNQNVVQSDNIITACGPQAAQEFGEQILAYLKLKK
jgi:protease I